MGAFLATIFRCVAVLARASIVKVVLVACNTDPTFVAYFTALNAARLTHSTVHEEPRFALETLTLVAENASFAQRITKKTVRTAEEETRIAVLAGGVVAL